MSSSQSIKGLRVPAVAEKLACSERTVWHLAQTDPSFPKAVKLSAKHTIFREDEIDAWILARATPSRRS
ncbi:hypothetical protein WJ79_19365 [Burkholderia ubonensis]|uniref:helix-turn-helix transcriptional regulator n=1 Tax=Burkholderia ubonensis TaxID=101571 RepID=UPI0007528A31|nr:AlpA family phage regulatory protein [Burkholderia ubonensis]KVO72419.1 hypothetical protein WJ79_19365 [Burkholderia ubonensis]